MSNFGLLLRRVVHCGGSATIIGGGDRERKEENGEVERYDWMRERRENKEGKEDKGVVVFVEKNGVSVKRDDEGL